MRLHQTSCLTACFSEEEQRGQADGDSLATEQVLRYLKGMVGSQKSLGPVWVALFIPVSFSSLFVMFQESFHPRVCFSFPLLADAQ